MDGPANASINSVGSNCGWRLDVLRSISAEPVSTNEHPWLLPEDAHPVVYVWFVPLPSMHITQGITKTHCVNKLLKAGFTVKILLADWFSQMDPRIGTDLDKIQNIGLYNIEVWRAVGMDIEKVEFIWLSHVINFHGSSIWNIVMDIGEANTKKIKRCSWKTATEDGIEVPLPWLQRATILFHEAVDIWLLDGDQKDVSVLAESIGKTRKGLSNRSFYVLPDLLEASDFSERSDPSRAISMEDKERHIHFKIMVRAFCPPKVAKGNPCLAYIEYVIFPWFGKIEIVCGKDSAKRTRTFTSMERLVAAYKCGTLHHTDVKYALVGALNKMLQPVRDHFEKNTFALGLLKICAGILYGE